MKTILITGINGYLGSHLAKAFKNDYKIIGLEYTLNNLFRLQDENFKIYSVENGIPDQLFNENAIDIIIHTATFYGRKNEKVSTIANANLFLPFYLLDKSIKNKCNVFINTDTVLDRFVSKYALTKRQFQEWLYIRKNEIKIVNMQLEHFYGPGSNNSNFITAMILKLKNNEPLIDLTLGEQQRDFVYIDDIISAYQTVVKKCPLQVNYSEFQVSTGNLISIKEIMILLKKLIGSQSKLNFGAINYRENELMISKTDNSAILKLGWKPQYFVREGLLKTSKKI